MLYTARHNEKFTLLQFDGSIAEFKPKPPTEREEQLVFLLMVMPDECPTELDEFDFLAIQCAHDLGTPVRLEPRAAMT